MKKQINFKKYEDVYYGYTTLNGKKCIVVSNNQSMNDRVSWFYVDYYDLAKAIKQFKEYDTKSISDEVQG